MSIDNPPPASPEVPPDPSTPEPSAPTPDEPLPFVTSATGEITTPSDGADDELTPSHGDPDRP